jgi:hypothetical protein
MVPIVIAIYLVTLKRRARKEAQLLLIIRSEAQNMNIDDRPIYKMLSCQYTLTKDTLEKNQWIISPIAHS